MIQRLTLSMVACGLILGLGAPCSAHESFQDVLKAKYMLKSFSCKTCHPNSDDRKIRTAFAERIAVQLKGKNLSEQFAEALKKDEDSKEKDPDSVGKDKGAVFDFEKLAAKDFDEAFKVVGQQKISFDELIKAGLFNGARLDKKAIEAAKAEKIESKK